MNPATTHGGALPVAAANEAKRIRQELRAVGVTTFGMLKFATRRLPGILHEGEHIRGAVYGRYSVGNGLMRWIEGVLVATDRRVIFLDRKPGFEAVDELTYDAVSGVQKSYAWPFAAVTLHTRIGNYTLRFANKRCIDNFMHYVEKRRLERASIYNPYPF
ncbi:MAG TPA: PH domain-containing protein [Candidatus Saccharimonadales bacterium]|nr:PH domain-containing protein [Candidatus Saccharimonadales bacterium]